MSRNVKVLICDDSPLVRKNMNNMLAKCDVTEIFEAFDGEEAVVKYAETSPNVVFMDIVMPKKTGLDALKDIRSLDPKAKVIMVSSIGTQANLKSAIDCGAYDFVQKPVSAETLAKILNKIESDL